MSYRRQLVFFVCQCVAQLGWADVIEFNNGDRLQGKILSMQDGVVIFKAEVLGKVDVPLAQVSSFSTNASNELHFKDGTVIKQAVQSGDKGKIELQSGTIVAAKSVALSELTMINPPQEPPVEWAGRVASGLTVDRGNTNSQDAYVDVNAKRETKFDRMILDMEFYEKREENPDTGEEATSKRHYLLGGHYDYFLSPKYYVYGDAKAEKEVTANLDLRLSIGGGGGYRWINTDTTGLDVEAGLSWINETFSDDTENTDYLALRTAWRYQHALSPETSFFHNGEWFPSLENSKDQLVKTETGVQTKISGSLFLEAKLLFDWDQTPAEGAEKEDTTYIFGVGWDF